MSGRSQNGFETRLTSPILCECMQITEAAVREAAAHDHPHTLKALIQCSGAGKGCTACHPLLREILAELKTTSGYPANCSVR